MAESVEQENGNRTGMRPGESQDGSRRRARGVIWLFRALCAVLFTCLFPFLNELNNPNENVRVYMTMAMVDHGTFRIDDEVAQFGWTNDMVRAPDKYGVPHHFSVKAPAISYVGVPVYAAYRWLAPAIGVERPTAASSHAVSVRWFRGAVWAMRFFCVQIPCLIGLLIFEVWLRRISRDVVLRLATVVAVGLGTNQLAYAMLFSSHSPVAWATFGSFALIVGPWRRLRPGQALPFVAGVGAGFATLLEYHALPMSAVLGLLAAVSFRRLRRILAFGAGAASQALLLMLYQWRAYGNPFTPGHKMCETASFAAAHAKGFFGISWPDPFALREISFNTTFGFFSTSPLMVIGLLTIPILVLNEHKIHRRWFGHISGAFAVMLSLWLAVSAFVSWRGGWTIGPRFFGSAPPFFGMLTLIVLESFASVGAWARVLARGLATGLALAGVAILGVLGLLTSSIPEDIARPLPDLVLPFLAAGIVPHHLGELLGFLGFGGFFWVLAALFVAAFLPLFLAANDSAGRVAARVAVAAAVFAIAVRPQFLPVPALEPLSDAAPPREYFVSIWEPAGRDRWSQLRQLHARREATACDYVKLARIERLFHHPELDATYTQESAKLGGCPKFFQRF